MPAMLRIKGKPQDIAFKILGVPPNMRNEVKGKNKKKVDRRLEFEETSRVR